MSHVTGYFFGLPDPRAQGYRVHQEHGLPYHAGGIANDNDNDKDNGNDIYTLKQYNYDYTDRDPK